MLKNLHHALDLDEGGSAPVPSSDGPHHQLTGGGGGESWAQPFHGSAGDIPSWERGEDSFADSHPVAGPYSTNHCYDSGGGYGPGWSGGEPYHQAGAELGWGDAAWGEAGGFDSVLIGHLVGELAGSGLGPIVVMPIEHLEINNITQVETTQILLNAANGGSIQIGGAVNAEGSQGLLGPSDGFHDPSHAGGLGTGGLGHDTTATNDVTLIAGNGDGNLIGGNVTAIADQHLPDAHFA